MEQVFRVSIHALPSNFQLMEPWNSFCTTGCILLSSAMQSETILEELDFCTSFSRQRIEQNGAGEQPPRGRLSSGSGRSCAVNDSNSGEHSMGGSPQLTMGQGWQGGSQNILRQTQMALGLWEQLHDTASTPSTIVPPPGAQRASVWERGSANSAA